MGRPWILDYDGANCTIGAAVGIIGEKWTFLVLREVFNAVRRFDDLQRRPQAPRQILSDRLARLGDRGLLRKVPYQEQGQRGRHEYPLTDAGPDLSPVLVALRQWGDRYAVGPAGPQALLTHRDCGQRVRLELTCAAGQKLASARGVAPAPRPGAR